MAFYFKYVPDFDYISRKPEAQIYDYVAVKNLFKRGKIRDDIFQNVTFFEKYQIVGDERPDNVAYKFYDDETLHWVVLLSNNILNVQSEWPLTQNSFDKLMLEKYGSYDKLYSGIHHYETKEIKTSGGNIIFKEGTILPPNWKSNGNFVEVKKTNISQIFSGNGIIPSNIVTVTINNGISGLAVNSEVIVSNVTPQIYNGRYRVTSVNIPFNDSIARSFTYALEDVPISANATITGKEEILFPLYNKDISGNAFYFEYYDDLLGYYVSLPSTSILTEVTNYQYEEKIEDKKRNIYLLKPRYLNVLFNDLQDIMRYKEGSQQYVNETLKRGENLRIYE